MSRRVWAWASWDWGSSGFHQVIIPFVFVVYLTDVVGADLPGPVSASGRVGWGLGAAGLLVALAAPITGQWADAAGRRRRALGTLTGVTVVTMAAMFFVRDGPDYFALGLVLLAVASVSVELATVPYYAMLRQVSTPTTLGRVSGFGWAVGYVGGIALLVGVYVGFIAGEGSTRGLLGISAADGLNIRVVTVVAAVWFALFALPVLFLNTEPAEPRPAAQRPGRLGVIASYRTLGRDLRALYRVSPHSVYFLGASALFRDGLAAIFTFGAVFAVTVYGVARDDVLLFGVAANVVAALGALVGGRLDDRVGPKAVIVTSLVGMLLAGTVLLVVSGPTAFWVLGLVLTVFVGPAQASARSYLARLAPRGHEGQLFGLYATTGRAVSFLAPTLVGLFTFLFGTDRAGIVGILLVLALGLAALGPLRAPPRACGNAPPRPAHGDLNEDVT